MSGLFSKPKTPALPAVPPPVAPVVSTGKDVYMAERDQRRALGKRKGLSKTVLGGQGEAGGTAFAESVGQRSLLGGNGG